MFTALGDVFALLDKMEREAKVDFSVIEKLDVLINQSREFERFWIENEEISIEDAFVLYHASRNSRLIFEKMKTRFLSAAEEHSNPAVIEDAIRVMPALSDLFSTVASLRTRPISPEIRSFVSKHTRATRSISADASMLPSCEEEIKEVDLKRLKTQFTRFSNTVREMFLEV